MVGGVWNGLLLGRVRSQAVPCKFCGAPDNDGHLFWECTFPPLVEIRENPEFHDLMRMDKAHWPRCLLWHGWLPMLSGCNGDSPWAGTAAESAHYLVEAALGGYSSALISAWDPPDGYDQVAVSCLVPDHPNVWTDGSLVLDKVAGISSSGAGFFAHQAAFLWDVRTWGQVDHLQSVGDFPAEDKANWPWCLLWHGWLPMLSGVNGASPWAVDASESAAYLLEVALGRYSSGLIAEWNPSDDFDHDMAVSSLPDHLDVWTDGSLVLDRLAGVSSSGSGFFCSPG